MTEWSAIAAAKPVYCCTMFLLASSVIFGEQHLIDGNVMLIHLLRLTSHREHPDKTACASDTQKRLKQLPGVIELERILNEWIGHESHLSTEQLWALAAGELEKSTRAPFEGAGGKFHNWLGFGILQCIWDNNTPQQLRLFKGSNFKLSITQIPANLGGEGWQSVNWSGSSINTFCIYLTY